MSVVYRGRVEVYRGYINQPSTLQDLHSRHGQYCTVVDDGSHKDLVDIHFTDGDAHSMRAFKNCVSRVKLSSAED